MPDVEPQDAKPIDAERLPCSTYADFTSDMSNKNVFIGISIIEKMKPVLCRTIVQMVAKCPNKTIGIFKVYQTFVYP